MRRFALGSILLLSLAACGDEPEANPPPIGSGGATTLQVASTGEPMGTDTDTDAGGGCVWDGLCASLLTCEGLCAGQNMCDLSCRDGVRCVDTVKEADILCAFPVETDTSSDSSSSGGSGSGTDTDTDASSSESSGSESGSDSSTGAACQGEGICQDAACADCVGADAPCDACVEDSGSYLCMVGDAC